MLRSACHDTDRERAEAPPVLAPGSRRARRVPVSAGAPSRKPAVFVAIGVLLLLLLLAGSAVWSSWRQPESTAAIRGVRDRASTRVFRLSRSGRGRRRARTGFPGRDDAGLGPRHRGDVRQERRGDPGVDPPRAAAARAAGPRRRGVRGAHQHACLRRAAVRSAARRSGRVLPRRFRMGSGDFG